LEKPEQQAFVKFFRSLDTPEEGTIRLFEREGNGSFYYTFHGDDAEYVAKNVYQTSTVIQRWFGDLPTTKLSQKAAENFLRDILLNKQMRIEIWKQSRLEWQLIRKASPGNLQDVEDFLFSNQQMTSAPVVLAVKIGISGDNKTVGSLIIQLGVKECLLLATTMEEKNYETKKIKSILDRCNVILTERKPSDFNAQNIAQDLNRLVEGKISLQALHNENNFDKFTLKHHDLSEYMRLDGPALTALDLFPTPQDGPHKSTSLYGLLNKCHTAQGSRLFTQWLKQPLLNLNDIKLRQSLQEDHLKQVPDLHRLSKKFLKKKATLQDVIRIYQVVIRLPALLQCLEARIPSDPELATLLEETYTKKIREYIAQLQKLEELVVTTIDLEALENHEYIIKAEFNEDLQNIREELRSINGQMENEFVNTAEKLRLEIEKKLRLENHSLYGYCLRMIGRNEASGKIRNKNDYIELSTQKSGTFFTTRALKQLSDSHRKLTEEYEQTQRGLVKEVIDIVATYCPSLESLGMTLAHMDVLVAFAHVSVMAPIPYVRPTMHPCGQGSVVLEEARHPCLEVQDYVNFIPNDVDMTRNSSEFLVITGPNMGGKSTYIRQVGVIALMAQMGCFVPCTKASLCVFDSILARVGAGDFQLKGVSTFMAEMLETSTILRAATRHSLVIIDELGRGTSTYDGLGLAWSISEYIATNIRCFCLFATHFHEITALNNTIPYVKNLHVTAHVDKQDVTLLYKVHEGVGDRSFGIHVAELADFPSAVVKVAKRKAKELDEEEDVLRGVKKRQEQDEDSQKKAEEGDDEGDEDKASNEANVLRVLDKYATDIEQNPYLKELLTNFFNEEEEGEDQSVTAMEY
ncbi:muts domain V-domain-containing protein, partial [Mycotypha africana]|uniref:muts domain V-domain-containing protein n=1 Tax=Mycotypha africana TaxID=64632 RepID=UPI0023019397